MGKVKVFRFITTLLVSVFVLFTILVLILIFYNPTRCYSKDEAQSIKEEIDKGWIPRFIPYDSEKICVYSEVDYSYSEVTIDKKGLNEKDITLLKNNIATNQKSNLPDGRKRSIQEENKQYIKIKNN